MQSTTINLSPEDRQRIKDETYRSRFGAKIFTCLMTTIFGITSLFQEKEPWSLKVVFIKMLFIGFIFVGFYCLARLVIFCTDWKFNLDARVGKKIASKGQITQFYKKTIRLRPGMDKELALFLKGCSELDPSLFAEDDWEPRFSDEEEYMVEYLPKSKVVIKISSMEES